VKILIISNMFPPFVMGGAEMAAHSLAVWLAEMGHEVRVLTCAPERSDEGVEVLAEGLTVERHYFKNIYQIYQADRDRSLSKVVWHFQDHFHSETERICASVIAEFRPDIINTHDLQGIGYNLLRAVGASKVPCVQTLHDFGFICVAMSMFQKGAECSRHHWVCQASAMIKRSYFSHIAALAFHSPSAALLDRHRPFLPSHREACAIPLALSFDNPPRSGDARGEVPRLLYVGQIEPWKGVDFLLSVLAEMPAPRKFHLSIVGGGSRLEPLRSRYGGEAWVTFRGKLPASQVGQFMADSDLLIVPSTWFENAPLVISQAIQMGLPILASRTGGLPEMVEAGTNGDLLPPGDAPAWKRCLERICAEPGVIEKWRSGAATMCDRFSRDALGARVVELFERMIACDRARPQAVAGGLCE